MRKKHRGQRLVRALGFLDCVFEIVAREHVAVDECLTEPSGLIGQHRLSPLSCGLRGVST